MGPRGTRRRLAALVGVAALAASAPAAQAAGTPQLGASWATDVTASSANLHAEVNPEGSPTFYRFEYETGAAYEANVAAGHEAFLGAASAPAGSEAFLGSGTSTLETLQHASGFAAGTAYRYRIVATNGEGTSEGAAHSLSTEEANPSFSLLDDRGWEMVSPADKNGGGVALPGSLHGGGDLQAAADGNSATFSSAASFAEGLGAPWASQYLSTRTASGWVTENVTLPTLSGAYGTEPDGVPYRLFSSDLSHAMVLEGRRCEEGEPCQLPYLLWEGGALAPLPAEAAGMRIASASPDLHRVLFEAEGGQLYAWSGGGLEPAALVPPGAGSGAEFQAASANGALTFYLEGEHLYRYSASTEASTDLTPSGAVKGMLGASADGTVAYYQDAGGLERWAEGTTMRVAEGPQAAAASDYPPATGSSRVSADGQTLAFLSEESEALSGYDNADRATGEPDSQVYLYRVGEGLRCVSCDPSGERPGGPATIPGAEPNGSLRAYRPRALSADGRRLFFETPDRLVTLDANGAPDVYEWEAPGEGTCARAGGCVDIVSSGSAGAGATFADASADGSDAFFLTEASLVGSDPSAGDLYDARVGGGFPEPTSGPPCVGDACRPIPAEPEDPAPLTLLTGPGNPPVAKPPTKRSCRRQASALRHLARGQRRLRRQARQARGARARRLAHRLARLAKRRRSLHRAYVRCRGGKAKQKEGRR